MEAQQEGKRLLRTAREILDPFIKSENVTSLDPFEVYPRLERAAIFAILEAQQEALNVMQDLTLKSFDNLKNKLDDTV